MPEIRFGRTNGHRLFAILPVGGTNRACFLGIAHCGACAMGLDKGDVIHIHAGFIQNRAHKVRLPVAIG